MAHILDMQQSTSTLLRLEAMCASLCVKDYQTVRVRQMQELNDYLIDTIRQCWYHTAGERVVAEYPKTWWDAFKLRWFPRVLLSRYPVEYITVKAEFRAYYPDYRPVVAGATVLEVRLPEQAQWRTI